jgi:thermolysin
MFDVPNNAKTYDFNNRSCNVFGCGTNTGTIYSASSSTFGTDGSLSNRASIGVDAHFFSQKVLQYVFNTFGRRGIDNNNNASLRMGHMVSRTHYGKSYANAFWDGASMTYGDGDSTTRPFDALDVVGHEMTHGITERTSNLRYQNESGAANESFSDIIGVAVEFYTGTLTGFGGQSYPADWWIGEDLYKSSNPANPTDGIRHMADPHIEGDPCHYSERYTGTSDSGGVHINSGIQNKVYYLLSDGGTNHKDTTGTVVTGIGWAEAAKIAFDADTKYCTIDDTYAKVANAWMNAAKNRVAQGLLPSTAPQQVYNAWKAGGVTPTVAP